MVLKFFRAFHKSTHSAPMTRANSPGATRNSV